MERSEKKRDFSPRKIASWTALEKEKKNNGGRRGEKKEEDKNKKKLRGASATRPAISH